MNEKSSPIPARSYDADLWRVPELPGKGAATGSQNTRKRKVSLRRVLRRVILLGFDSGAVVGSYLVTVMLVFSPDLAQQFQTAPLIAAFAGITAFTFYASGLYNFSWRFFSFGHAIHVVAVSLFAHGVAWAFALSLLGKAPGLGFVAAALLQLLLATAFMLSARSLRRSLRQWVRPGRAVGALMAGPASEGQAIALLVGSPQWAMSVLELIKAEDSPSFEVAGLLLPSLSDPIDRVGKARVLGSHDMLVDVVNGLALQGRRPTILIASADGIHLSQREMARLSHRAKELGLEVSKIRECWSQILLNSNSSRTQDVDLRSLLGRTEYKTNGAIVAGQVEGNCVLTTGAGGTIGSELCWQLASFKPSRLVLVDHCEYNLYKIELALREQYPGLDICAEICNIRDAGEVRRVFDAHRPSIVYHAAALKHVPIVEANPCGGVHTNILGTKIVADAMCEFGTRAMVQVSTDKAVNPVGMMGATKRVGELYCQALDMCGVDDPNAPRFMTVRFGNVLGSSGSILPLFQRQLEQGKPLTVTHPEIERYFMTVREAVQLILQSSSSALETDSERGTIFVLDMGNPVRIIDLAYRLIAAYGLEPEVDVPIKIVGLRPGEKLFEELFDTCEEKLESRLEGILEARSQPIPLPFIKKSIEQLERAVRAGDHDEAVRVTHHLARLPNSGVQFNLPPPHTNRGKILSIDTVS